ncbi:MAG: hypothetical protein IPJ98_10470 [Bryobacterales bacterium]|nr:hypothetical protein [Bryobacterales bacterium]
MPRALLLLTLTICAFAQAPAPQKPFTPNAQLKVPARVGYDAVIIGTKQKLEQGGTRELTITSAELALTFPNRVENVIATAAEKLLIIRGSLRNAEKTSNINLGPSAVIGLRLPQRYTGTGKFAFVRHYDPVTLNHVRHNLKGGQSGSFVGVWRIPADFTDFRLGFTSDTPKYVAWYDFTSTITRLKSIHAAPDGLTTNPPPRSPPTRASRSTASPSNPAPSPAPPASPAPPLTSPNPSTSSTSTSPTPSSCPPAGAGNTSTPSSSEPTAPPPSSTRTSSTKPTTPPGPATSTPAPPPPPNSSSTPLPPSPPAPSASP